MLKKIIIAVISASFIASAALADVTNVGVRISAATLGATGSTQTDSTGTFKNTGGTAVTHKENDGDFELPSIFIERAVDVNDQFSFNFGMDYVPMTEDVATLGGGDGVDAKVAAGNLMTFYVQPTFVVNDMVSVYAKAGFSTGDLEVTNVTRQAGSASQTDDEQSTDTNQNKTLSGPIFGAGIQIKPAVGVISFIRLEGTRTDFDEVQHTNSNGKLSKADAEMDLITLSIGKSF
jgi:opacity protein-like surface antigen